MSYLIEISINMLKHKSIENSKESMKEILINAANNHECEFYYFNYELMGKNRRINKTNIIITFMLPEKDENLIKFIRIVKKFKGVYIESLGLDCGKYSLMYASKRYLKSMNDHIVKEYLSNKKKGKLFKQDSIIYKTITSN